MKIAGFHKISISLQTLVSVLTIILVAIGCFYMVNPIYYQVTALILLLAVSMLAMLFDIIPVLVAAMLSAFVWNFFFIPPIFTFHIARSEDAFLFIMYFVIALVNAVLTYKIKETEKKARDREEKANAIKLYNTLLNSLSHELKTPIATIIGAADTLKEGKDFLHPQQQQELISQIGIAGNRLNKEVENLLHASRLESGVLQLHLDWVDTNELVNAIFNKLEESARGYTLEFVQDENMPLVKLDALLMHQVLFNLLHNAIQYNVSGTIISVQTNMDNEHFQLMVKDNGIGFAEEEQQKVFDRFYRLPHHQVGGTGLGLSIVKGFVEAHGGTVQLSSTKAAGACFLIKIPVESSYLNKLNNE